jgi:hypothetical protein
MPADRTYVWYSGVGMFRLDPDEGAALLAGLTLGNDVLRGQKRSAERSGEEAAPKLQAEADDCSPEALRPKVPYADALALMVETMLGAHKRPQGIGRGGESSGLPSAGAVERGSRRAVP